MVDAYPHLMPLSAGGAKEQACVVQRRGSTGRFLRETLTRVKNSERLAMAAHIQLRAVD